MKDVSTASAVPATPALVIDAAIAEKNVRKLASYGKQHKLGIRPHTKTHKSIRMAKLQAEFGAVGMTVAKVGEADYMREAHDDILLAYPAVDAPRTTHLAELAKDKSKTYRVAVDSQMAADAIASAARDAGVTIGILVDLDTGFHRTGLQTPQLAQELAQHVSKMKGIRLDGLFTYYGHIILPVEQQNAVLTEISQKLQETLDLWRKNGLEAKIVTAGSTPTGYQSHLIPQLTEIRPGTYIYMDMNCARGNFCTLDECAATLHCTVVSNAVPGKVVLDAGNKTLTSDRNALDLESGFGHVVEYPQAKIVRLSEEHGEIDISKCDRAPKLGERVRVIPNHICPCVNLQDNAWLQLSDGKLEKLPIDARGKLS